MKQAGLIGMAMLGLCGCATQQLTHDKCIIRHISGFVGTTGNQQPITVARNGSPCVFGITIDRGTMGVGGEIPTQPAHGTASIRTTSDATVISYTPAPDFVGSDEFEVVFNRQFNLTVLASVVPLPEK